MIQFLFIAASLLTAVLAVLCVYLFRRTRNHKEPEAQAPVKPYLKPNVKIVDIADDLQTNKAYLSRIINSYFKKNFSQFINWYRVRDAMDSFVKEPDIDITTMAGRSGFQSMTTFNTAFTRYTGMTPGEWCKKYKNEMRNEMVNAGKKTRKAEK